MDEAVLLAVSRKWMDELYKLHELVHDMDNDPDEAVNVALMQRDCALVMLGMDALVQFHPCFAEDLLDLHQRLVELLDAQSPSWAKRRSSE